MGQRLSICAIFVVSICLAGQIDGPAKQQVLTHERDVETAFQWDHLPRWEGHRLVGFYNNVSASPIVYTIDESGGREEMLFALQDAAQIRIYNIAGSADGQIAVVGSAVTSDNRPTAFLARIASDHKEQVVTRTWPYVPNVVTFAPDNTLWTIGILKINDPDHFAPGHFLRRFDASGKMVGSSTVEIRGDNTGGEQVSFLRSSRDRVGWYTRDGEYLEFSPDGAVIGRYEGPQGADWRHVDGVAMSDADNVVIGLFEKGASGFFALNRTTGTWDRMLLPKRDTPPWAWVLGFDGATLVTYSTNGRLTRYRVSEE